MLNWQTLPLGEVVTFQRGYDLPQRARKPGEVPLVSSAGVTACHNVAMVKAPGVVTGRYGTIGELFYLDQPFWPLNTTLYVRDFHGNHPKFVYYLLQRFDFHSFSGKSGVPGVNRNDLHTEVVFVPANVDEQHAIADMLSDLDTLLDDLIRLTAKKRNLKLAAMQQLLTGRTRLPGFSGEWAVKLLGEIATIKDGTHQTPKYVPSGIPFYSVEQVTSGDFSNTKFITEEEHQFLTRTCKIERGDILMTRIGSIGDCKLIDWDVNASFYVSLALLKIRPEFSAAYITQYSNTSAFKNEVELHSLPSAIPRKINLGPISNIRVKVPPTFAEQTAIATVLTDMDAELDALDARLTKTRALKQAMMQELLTGKSRLPTLEAAHA